MPDRRREPRARGSALGRDELRLAIWDTSDQVYDSVVLLDDFRWSVEASDPGTDIVIE